MALLEEEADDDEVAIDTGEVEEEDEIPDEGEEVESDIEKIDARYEAVQVNPRFVNMYSPDYVAFTRPSTSPVRGYVSSIHSELQSMLTVIQSQGNHDTDSTHPVSHVRLLVDTLIPF